MNNQSLTPFVHKGFTVQPFMELALVTHYRVTTPSGKVLSTVCRTQDEVRGLVYDYRNTDPKDRCEECSAPSKGPLMLREDGYHRVCHGCAKELYPQHYAYFRRNGWYPRTQSEVQSGQIEQGSVDKNWDGSSKFKAGVPA